MERCPCSPLIVFRVGSDVGQEISLPPAQYGALAGPIFYGGDWRPATFVGTPQGEWRSTENPRSLDGVAEHVLGIADSESRATSRRAVRTRRGSSDAANPRRTSNISA